MKNLFSTLICALALLSTTVFAQSKDGIKKPTGFSTGMYVTADGKINLNIEKRHEKTMRFVISDESGRVYMEEIVGRKPLKYAMKFNVKALEAGKYTLDVICGGEKETRSFVIHEREAVAPSRVLAFQ